MEEFFSAVGYNGEGFPPLWDTTEENIFRCGIQQRKISGWQTIFFLLYPTTQDIFLRCILHHNRILCSVLYPRKIFSIVSHNAAGFLPLYPRMEDISSILGYNGRGYFHCGIKRKRFVSVVGYNRRGFFHFGIQRKSFFPLWDTMEKNYTRRMIFLNFKLLSLPSNKNLEKICFLNSQSNP
jgi:hypothetical protein